MLIGPYEIQRTKYKRKALIFQKQSVAYCTKYLYQGRTFLNGTASKGLVSGNIIPPNLEQVHKSWETYIKSHRKNKEPLLVEQLNSIIYFVQVIIFIFLRSQTRAIQIKPEKTLLGYRILGRVPIDAISFRLPRSFGRRATITYFNVLFFRVSENRGQI